MVLQDNKILTTIGARRSASIEIYVVGGFVRDFLKRGAARWISSSLATASSSPSCCEAFAFAKAGSVSQFRTAMLGDDIARVRRCGESSR
jgi:hypothetical protein